MQGWGFALIGTLGAIWRRIRNGPELVRVGDVEDELPIEHHHTVAGRVVWHRHSTKVYKHPYVWGDAHPGEPTPGEAADA